VRLLIEAHKNSTSGPCAIGAKEALCWSREESLSSLTQARIRFPESKHKRQDSSSPVPLAFIDLLDVL